MSCYLSTANKPHHYTLASVVVLDKDYDVVYDTLEPCVLYVTDFIGRHADEGSERTLMLNFHSQGQADEHKDKAVLASKYIGPHKDIITPCIGGFDSPEYNFCEEDLKTLYETSEELDYPTGHSVMHVFAEEVQDRLNQNADARQVQQEKDRVEEWKKNVARIRAERGPRNCARKEEKAKVHEVQQSVKNIEAQPIEYRDNKERVERLGLLASTWAKEVVDPTRHKDAEWYEGENTDKVDHIAQFLAWLFTDDNDVMLQAHEELHGQIEKACGIISGKYEYYD